MNFAVADRIEILCARVAGYRFQASLVFLRSMHCVHDDTGSVTRQLSAGPCDIIEPNSQNHQDTSDKTNNSGTSLTSDLHNRNNACFQNLSSQGAV
jgi:hypothetical protein